MKTAKSILAVLGTRPEAVKMGPVLTELKKRNTFRVSLCLTGQHNGQAEQALDCFGLTPDYDLSALRPGQGLSELTAAILQGLEPVLEKEQPDLVLVHGDTTSAFAACLACFYRKIPVAHVEAGLRTGNIYSPYPEELNRRAIGIMAQLHFAPTEKAGENLLSEGKDPSSVFVTGNTVVDALKQVSGRPGPLLAWAEGSRLLLVTAHRRESLEKMEQMLLAVRRAAEEAPDIKIICPLPVNPKARRAAERAFEGFARARLTEPLPVDEFHALLHRAYLVLTDSGGIQEEAAACHRPVLVLRDITERTEGLEAGALRLAGTDPESIYRALTELLRSEALCRAMAEAPNPYGDGRAAERIADILENILLGGHSHDI